MKWILLIMAGLLVAGLCIAPAAAEDLNDPAKIIVIKLNINKGAVTEKSVEIRYGHPPNLGHQKGNFTATLKSADGIPLFTFDIWDPRNQFEDHEIMEDNETCDLTGSMWHTDNVDLPIILPYHPEIRTFELRDKGSRDLLISVNITPAVESFLLRFPQERGVMIISPVQGTVFLVAGCLLAFALLVILVRLVRRS